MSREYFLTKKIGVLMGGWSREREVSLRSGKNIYESLKRQGFNTIPIDVNKNIAEALTKERIDIAFVMLHGKPGEDGTIQSLLELMGIPYTGSDAFSSALGMDKIASKRIFESQNIPIPPYLFIPQKSNLETNVKMGLKKLGLPVVIKPREEGSSIGVHIVEDESQLIEKAEEVRVQFGDLFFEKYINGMTATCGIIGTNENTRPVPILELVPKKRFYDYEAKYTKGLTEFIIPARLSEDVYKKAQKFALAAHNVIGCKGFSRVDMIVSSDGVPYVLEVNTIPGMTDISDLPAEAEADGISYDELTFEILKSAIRQEII